MGCDEQSDRQAPFRPRLIQGQPFQAGGRTWVPVVRVASFGRAKALIGKDRHGGWGGGFNWITPLALLEKTDEGERRLEIYDATAATLRRLGLTALAITLFFTALRRLLRRRREARENSTTSARVPGSD